MCQALFVVGLGIQQRARNMNLFPCGVCILVCRWEQAINIINYAATHVEEK